MIITIGRRWRAAGRPRRGGPEGRRAVHVCVYVYMCICVCIYICIYTRIHIYVYIHMYTYRSIYIYIYILHAYICIYMPSQLLLARQGPCIYVYMYVCVYIYIYIYTHIHVYIHIVIYFAAKPSNGLSVHVSILSKHARKYLMVNRGTSAKNPFVPTSFGSCQNIAPGAPLIYIYIYIYIHIYIYVFACRQGAQASPLKIHQRGVQWKKRVVVHITFYIVLL